MEWLKEYPPGMVLVIILLVFLSVGQLASAYRSIKQVKDDADRPMDDLRVVMDNHTDRLSTLERDVSAINIDLKKIHKKDSKREHDEKSEQRAILALLNHAITGNNEAELESAKDDLNKVVWGEGEKHD